MILKGKKVSLRPLEITDAEILQKWYMDKAFRVAYDAYESIDIDDIKADILRCQGGMFDPTLTKLPMMVLRNRDLQPIGLCCLKNIDRLNRNAEVLMGIGEQEMRLSGYGVDMMITLLDMAYFDLGLEKTYMRIQETQASGLQNAIKFGYKAEGHLRNQAFVDGKFVNVFFLGLTKEDYSKLSIVPRWKNVKER